VYVGNDHAVRFGYMPIATIANPNKKELSVIGRINSGPGSH